MYNVQLIVGLNNGGKSTIHVLGLRHISAFSVEKACKGTTKFRNTQIFSCFFCIFKKKAVLLQPIYEHSHSVIFIRGANRVRHQVCNSPYRSAKWTGNLSLRSPHHKQHKLGLRWGPYFG